MNILLTGATGFIGRYTLNQLIHSGSYIRVVSRKKIPNNYRNIKNIEWINCEFSGLNDSYLNNIDSIINLAAAGVSPKKATLEEMIEININFPIRLLMMASKKNVKKFISVGTCYEYGHKEKNNLCKPSDLLDPIGIYAATKASSFFALKQLSLELGIDFCYGRIFNAYGKSFGNNTFWQLLYKSAKSGTDFSMTTGEQIRDFIHVENVAKILVKISSSYNKKIITPYIFNIGTGEAQKLKDFASKEWSFLKAKGKLNIGAISQRKNEPQYIVADVSNLIY